LKLTRDALNGVLWVDDAQIAEISTIKHWSTESYISLAMDF
jgi:Holliday junction resolvase RusA-like endonuclease